MASDVMYVNVKRGESEAGRLRELPVVLAPNDWSRSEAFESQYVQAHRLTDAAAAESVRH